MLVAHGVCSEWNAAGLGLLVANGATYSWTFLVDWTDALGMLKVGISEQGSPPRRKNGSPQGFQHLLAGRWRLSRRRQRPGLPTTTEVSDDVTQTPTTTDIPSPRF